jgi:hypothetical protein
MKWIAHRGNVDGKKEHFENHPSYIDEALNLGYDAEVDIWVKDNILFLGHDVPEYIITQQWLEQRADKLWIHCKNSNAIEWFNSVDGFNYFWHENDDYTLLSNGKVLVKPGSKLIQNSICCMPEMGLNGDITNCFAIMTDNITYFKNKI